jgi:NTE family protein
LIKEVHALQGRANLRVIPPLCPPAISATDFTHAAELIDRAHLATFRWLDGEDALSSQDQTRVLGFHRHD